MLSQISHLQATPLRGCFASIKSNNSRQIVFVFQCLFAVRHRKSSQDQSCGNRSVLLTGMTFNNNNNRRCLDGTVAVETGISQGLLLCWWCPQKNRGANWLCLWDRPVFTALVATSAALNFIRKGRRGGSRLLLLAQSLCETHCQFVYPIQNRLCLRREMFVCGSDLN